MIASLQEVPTESPCRTDMVGAFGCLCVRWKMTDLGRGLPASRRGRGCPHRRERTPRPARLEALVRPHAAVGSRAAEPQRNAGRRSGIASAGRVARRGAATPSSHPDPATLLHISTTACRRMRSAPAPAPLGPPLSSWTPRLLRAGRGGPWPAPRHNRGSRRGGNGESHPSASTRQQQTRR